MTRYLLIALTLFAFATPSYAACVLVSITRDVDTTREPVDTPASHANDDIPESLTSLETGGEEPWVVYKNTQTGRSCQP